MEQSTSASYRRVGHRGLPKKYPENSLIGILATLDTGAHAVEFDVQLTKDGVPVICHDVTLERTGTANIGIMDVTFSELSTLSCHEPARFGETYAPCQITSLADACDVLASKVGRVNGHTIDLFVEVKPESLAVFGNRLVLDAVLSATNCIAKERTIISFDYDFVALAKREGVRVGWVLSFYDELSEKRANILNADFLICDYKKMLTRQPLWQGDWQWFVYDIVDPALARLWFERGVTYIESWDVEAI